MRRLVVLVLFISKLWAQEEESGGPKTIWNSALWDSKGEVGLEVREFENDGVSSTHEHGLGVLSRLESLYKNEGTQVKARALGRLDKHDPTRDILILEDAYLSQELGAENPYKFLMGYKIFNWSATEAFHPADVINSRNYDSNLENLDKVGELTIELSGPLFGGEVALYYWPRYERPHFPGASSRLGIGFDIRTPVFVDSNTETEIADRQGHQYGARFDYKLGTADIALFYLNHMDRLHPIIGESSYIYIPLVGYIPASMPTIPYFFSVEEFGGTLQYAVGPMVFKAEAVTRNFKEDRVIYTVSGFRRPVDHQEAALGAEYTYGFAGGGEVMLLAEATSYFGIDTVTRADQGAFQRDAFLGARFALNDAASREFFASFIFDLERSHEFFYNLKYTQRLGDSWQSTLGVRIYDAPMKGSSAIGLESLDGDNQAFFNLIRFF
ncbi:MAG: hypothetical protein HYV97_18900 [Bdellovibrio sp.]|nr:hypothetical protein [Bdellovibrio sp.]